MFIPDLMSYWALPYYVGFLSAAQYYGAAHQKPQLFQVVTLKNHRSLHCGRVHIEFIAKKQINTQLLIPFNTLAGMIYVASPELLAADLISAPHHAAGINNVATILSDMFDILDADKLITLTRHNTEVFWIQRLGWMFEFLGNELLANALFTLLNGKSLHWVRLVSKIPYTPIERNKKWHIIVNTTLEID